MKRLSIRQLSLRISAVAVLVGLCTSFAQTQDPMEEPEYGTFNLKAGFEPDPKVIKVEAGGPIKTKLGGFEHWVAKKPDVRVNYTAGKFVLTFYAECEEDSTLLINLPDGTWIGNDDGPNTGLNPLLQFKAPKSGQYDIWVGTLNEGKTPPAKLFITEKKK
jgi:hypothetical protein